MVISTAPESYAAACKALAEAPHIHLEGLNGVRLWVIGGKEDYLATEESLRSWIDEMGEDSANKCVILDRVGHWGTVEAPKRVAEALVEFLTSKFI